MDKRFQRRKVVDPAVADMLSDIERKQKITGLPKGKRDKARRDAARHKVGLDLPPILHKSLRLIADREHISISSLVAFLVWQGILDYKADRVDLSPFKRLSRCPRFEYILDLTKMDIP